MAWHLSRDRMAFSGFLRERTDALLEEPRRAGTDADRVHDLNAQLDEIGAFPDAIKKAERSGDPLLHMQAVPDPGRLGDRFVLRKRSWKASYLADLPTSSPYGQLVTQGSDPADLLDRLEHSRPFRWREER